MAVLGLDVGGANLKAALSTGQATTRPFPLYKQPAHLKAALKLLTVKLPAPQRVALTMTGELCDCFATKKDGVRHILASVADAFPGTPLSVYGTRGAFISREEAEASPLEVASANWLALATFAGRHAPSGNALLVDIGTTTTDIVPLKDGIPVPLARTDPERLKSGELVYRGWRRTPLCALYPEGAAEFFATSHDLCLALGLVPENASDADTADGKPATRPFALARIARMACADTDLMGEQECLNLARLLYDRLLADIRRPIRAAEAVVLSGSGAFLLREDWPGAVRLSEKLGPELSEAACAFAVATLAEG